MSTKRSITARLNPTRKAKMEALAGLYYRGSQADTIRRWVDEQFDLVFGDIDPTALLDDRVDETDAHHIMGDTETDTDDLLDEVGIDDELRLDGDDVPAVAQDGGTLTHQPDRFQTTLGPQELKQAGPALEWDELRDIVADDAHWSDSLEIHAKRVTPGTLKSNHKLASRVVAAIARSEAKGWIVTEETLEELIDEYLGHLHTRADDVEGRRYIHTTYRPLIEEHLWAHPDPTTDVLIAEKDAYRERVEHRLENPWQALDEEFTPGTVLDTDRWLDVDERGYWDSTAYKDWQADVGTFLQDIGVLLYMRAEHDLRELDLAVVPDQYAHVDVWIIEATRELLREFIDAVPNEDTREEILTHNVPDVIEEYIRYVYKNQ